MNKKIIIIALAVSVIALAVTPLLQSTGLATAPLAELPEKSEVFLQNIGVTAGNLVKINIVKILEA